MPSRGDAPETLRGPVLLLLGQGWPRVLLEAELADRGFDVAARPDVRAAVLRPPAGPGPGSLAAVLADETAAPEGDRALLDLLLDRHGRPPVVLLASGTAAPPVGPWTRVLRRPASVGAIADAVEAAARGA